MPHLRERHVLSCILKKLRFSRVVTIQGPRQSGKSVFARELLPKTLKKAKYISLDDKIERAQAQDAPRVFLKRFSTVHPLVIDEAQKAPDLFDAIKLQVDENPQPGQYVLLGSTEFSRETKIRESLTGRMSPTRIFTFNLKEVLKTPFASQKKGNFFSFLPKEAEIFREQILQHLNRGGFPGIFSIRDESERLEALDGWLKLTCERDMHQFNAEADSDLTEGILRALPILDRPDVTSLARKLNEESRKIEKHLKLLVQLFVIHKLSPHSIGGGKPLYYLCDVGLATHLGASLDRQLQTWVLHEFLARRSYQGILRLEIQYFRGSRGGHVDFVLTEADSRVTLIKVIPHERYDLRDFEILGATKKKIAAKNPGVQIDCIALGPYSGKRSLTEEVTGIPWEFIV